MKNINNHAYAYYYGYDFDIGYDYVKNGMHMNTSHIHVMNTSHIHVGISVCKINC